MSSDKRNRIKLTLNDILLLSKKYNDDYISYKSALILRVDENTTVEYYNVLIKDLNDPTKLNEFTIVSPSVANSAECKGMLSEKEQKQGKAIKAVSVPVSRISDYSRLACGDFAVPANAPAHMKDRIQKAVLDSAKTVADNTNLLLDASMSLCKACENALDSMKKASLVARTTGYNPLYRTEYKDPTDGKLKKCVPKVKINLKAFRYNAASDKQNAAMKVHEGKIGSCFISRASKNECNFLPSIIDAKRTKNDPKNRELEALYDGKTLTTDTIGLVFKPFSRFNGDLSVSACAVGNNFYVKYSTFKLTVNPNMSFSIEHVADKDRLNELVDDFGFYYDEESAKPDPVQQDTAAINPSDPFNAPLPDDEKRDRITINA